MPRVPKRRRSGSMRSGESERCVPCARLSAGSDSGSPNSAHTKLITLRPAVT